VQSKDPEQEPTPSQRSLTDDEIETAPDDESEEALIREEDDDIGEGMDWPGW
jgi:hypothetical protein